VQLFVKYGTPLVVLNLVKRKEKKPRESILSQEFTFVNCLVFAGQSFHSRFYPLHRSTIKYLNQFLPPDKRIVLIAWDMAKCAKSKDGNVLTTLDDLASSGLA
jgi:hypothetical protein